MRARFAPHRKASRLRRNRRSATLPIDPLLARTRTAMAFWSWSKTAATNATADATINWAEGQSPSSVNDSARAMMARTAEWRDDVSGTITTGGTSTAYTVASNQGFDSLAHLNGAMIAFVPHTTCGATVTLNVDGLGAKPLRTSPGVELGAGVLIQGTPYVATYNNADGAFYLQGFFGNPFNVPIGGLMPYLGSSAPNSSFVLPFGQAISRTTYATMFSLVGTTFGAGDGSTTFSLPDLRGRSIFGLDNMGGSAANIITNAGSGIVGTTLGAVGGAQNVTVSQANLPGATLTTTITDPGHSHFFFSNHNTASLISFDPGGAGQTSAGAGSVVNKASVESTTTGITASTALGGSGTAVNKMPPAMVLPFILRVV
jgi:microcystin-dependent protein